MNRKWTGVFFLLPFTMLSACGGPADWSAQNDLVPEDDLSAYSELAKADTGYLNQSATEFHADLYGQVLVQKSVGNIERVEDDKIWFETMCMINGKNFVVSPPSRLGGPPSQ